MLFVGLTLYCGTVWLQLIKSSAVSTSKIAKYIAKAISYITKAKTTEDKNSPKFNDFEDFKGTTNLATSNQSTSIQIDELENNFKSSNNRLCILENNCLKFDDTIEDQSFKIKALQAENSQLSERITQLNQGYRDLLQSNLNFKERIAGFEELVFKINILQPHKEEPTPNSSLSYANTTSELSIRELRSAVCKETYKRSRGNLLAISEPNIGWVEAISGLRGHERRRST